ncbi:MAG: hypothetical protein JXB17_07695 [Bacteroidales bacterium]|nr:hypothetical protein [Bacteroidales bacterium]
MIKFAIKNKILMQLPILPEFVETKLFLEGRDAWIFSWRLEKEGPILSKDTITLYVVAKLKKEFHQYNECKHYKYLCKIKLTQDIYRPKLTITKRA